jgi:hypothetical protein
LHAAGDDRFCGTELHVVAVSLHTESNFNSVAKCSVFGRIARAEDRLRAWVARNVIQLKVGFALVADVIHCVVGAVLRSDASRAARVAVKSVVSCCASHIGTSATGIVAFVFFVKSGHRAEEVGRRCVGASVRAAGSRGDIACDLEILGRDACFTGAALFGVLPRIASCSGAVSAISIVSHASLVRDSFTLAGADLGHCIGGSIHDLAGVRRRWIWTNLAKLITSRASLSHCPWVFEVLRILARERLSGVHIRVTDASSA